MKNKLLHLVFLCIPFAFLAQEATTLPQNRVLSIIDSTDAGNMVLTQSFEINVPLDSVWNAYTTEQGWKNWAAPLAQIDFKINGIIQTNYNERGAIGDDATITLHVVNYIPKRMLTLQAELTENFPEFMKKDEKELFNMVVFEEISPLKTKVISYGIGYKNNEKYKSLMKFFIQGNAQSYANLISYLETGKSSLNY